MWEKTISHWSSLLQSKRSRSVRTGPGPDVLAVAAVDVVGEEVHAVHTLGGQVVQSPDDALALALAVLPSGVAEPPIFNVSLILMDELLARRLALALELGAVVGLVEVRIAEEVLRAVGPAFDEIRASMRRIAGTAGRYTAGAPGPVNPARSCLSARW